MLRRTLTVLSALYAGTWVVNRSLRRVDGSSMEPTLRAGDIILTVRAAPAVGTVVAWRVRDGWRIKRVAAVGPATVVRPEGRWRVDAGEVFLLGDAHERSTDSRTYGGVPSAAVAHRAIAVIWPRPRLLRPSALPLPTPLTISTSRYPRIPG